MFFILDVRHTMAYHGPPPSLRRKTCYSIYAARMRAVHFHICALGVILDDDW
jgi:hypothetical protein